MEAVRKVALTNLGFSCFKNSILTKIPESYLSQLLYSLEILCRDEENTVRDKGLKTLCKIGLSMTNSAMLEKFNPIVERLAGDKLSGARASACTLIFVPYQTSSISSKVAHRSAYAALCRDVDPLVRREAATNLWRVAVVDSAHFEHDFMYLLEHLALEDANESVRSAALQSCGALRDLIDPQVFVDHILPLILAGSQDISLHVRQMAADQIHYLCEVQAGVDDGVDDTLVKTTWAIPIPTLQSVLGVVAVGAMVYGAYYGVTTMKQVLESVNSSGKEIVEHIKIGREIWTANGCQALFNIYPKIYLRKPN